MAPGARIVAALAALLAAAATGGDARPSKIGAGRTGWGAELGRVAREKCSQPGAAGWGKGMEAGRGRGPWETSWVRRRRKLRLGEEGDRSRQGPDGEGGVGMCPGIAGARKRLKGGLAVDLTRSIAYLLWTWPFAGCPDDREDKVWATSFTKTY